MEIIRKKHQDKRYPVVYNGRPLMPMRQNRAWKLIKKDLAVLEYDRKIDVHYVRLKKEPSGYDTQDINLGVDPGSTFDGFTLNSKYCNHLNIELIHRPKQGDHSIKVRLQKRSLYRRMRRCRLRHRPARFESRTSSKVAPTIRSMINYRIWLSAKLLKYFPVFRVVIEKVAFNHYKNTNGRGFSPVEQSFKKYVEFIYSQDILVNNVNGYTTSKLRKSLFGTPGVPDPKLKDKGSKGFFAHCVDSYILSNIGLDSIPKVNPKSTYVTIGLKYRRKLTVFKSHYKDKKFYKKFLKGGVMKLYYPLSKLKTIRVKISESKSNHGPWEYFQPPVRECKKASNKKFGRKKGNLTKLNINNEWVSRKIYSVCTT